MMRFCKATNFTIIHDTWILQLGERCSSNSKKTFGFATESKIISGWKQKDKIVCNSCDSNLVLVLAKSAAELPEIWRVVKVKSRVN